MSKKIYADRESVVAIVEEIDMAERKLRAMKQYIQITDGTIGNVSTVIGLFKGAQENVGNITKELKKFL